MSTLSRLLLLLWLYTLTLALGGSPARADELDEALAPEPAASDAYADAATRPHTPITVAISGKYAHRTTGKSDVGATLSVAFPLGVFAARRAPAAIVQTSTPGAKEPAQAEGEPAAPTDDGADAAEDPALPIPVVITAEIAAEAIHAAIHAARLDTSTARLDSLEARARAAAMLPTLHLRTTRAIDESQRLSPTLDDPDRVLASGGSGLWLEARLSWRLDRVLFPTETLAIEWLRLARAQAKARLGKAVLSRLYDYQEARALEADPLADAAAHRKATLRVLEAQTSLDLLTSGWFSRWLAVEGRGGAAATTSSPRAGTRGR